MKNIPARVEDLSPAMFSSSTAPFLRCLYKSTPFQSRQAFPRHIPPFRSAGFSSGRRGTRSYRYTRLQILRELWLTSPLFKRSVIASGVSFTGFAVYHVEQVPESGRWRLNWIQPATELEMGKRRFEQLMSIYGSQILPDSHPATRQVTRVLERLISLSGVVESGWEVRVINAPNEMNAFVLPGFVSPWNRGYQVSAHLCRGKVFVFSGILPICEGDDGLAAVLGHEMAHNVAHHAAENMTRYSFIMPFAMIASFLMDVSDGIFLKLLDYAYDKPGSRAEEVRD